MKLLTIFTTTFNRAYCLQQLYDSLLLQKSTNFKWLIIDDGSSDNTKELIEKWQSESRVEIIYIHQSNQGMHVGHNTAYENIDTELNVCIDSDDYIVEDAVQQICDKWAICSLDDNIAGIVGLDVFKSGKIVGKGFPTDLKTSTLQDIYFKHNCVGDKKLVLRTDIVLKYPRYPIFAGEKFVPLGILYLMIDQDYKLSCLNSPLCVVEYLEDGSTMNIYKQYKRHPKGFRHSRFVELKYLNIAGELIKKTLHLISSTLFIGDFAFFKGNPRKILTALCLPLGFLFHQFVKSKSK